MFTKIADFLSEPIVLIIMIVLLLGLIGLMVFLRMRPRDED
jgi:fumarate reductase subunit C